MGDYQYRDQDDDQGTFLGKDRDLDVSCCAFRDLEKALLQSDLSPGCDLLTVQQNQYPEARMERAGMYSLR